MEIALHKMAMVAIVAMAIVTIKVTTIHRTMATAMETTKGPQLRRPTSFQPKTTMGRNILPVTPA